ncbi:hypothetical protein L596_003832 [Steinernema carpocapsae]|uniref:G-protein coupled receptors family 1 profile domain-containing protein n=1 Tax=Steinernema carpocapsae TaxID=34508 RepID=A0A4U8UTP7_STECR|nr:hypothetical protein L596_003832 [Steinernema carpocapsae]
MMFDCSPCMYDANSTNSSAMVEFVLPTYSHNGSSSNVSSDDCDGCVHAINISDSVPLQWALPMYGYVMPLLVALTVVTNSFIVIVLWQKHLRTPTNYVLLSMAVTDLLTGLTSVPWFIYYYTLNGYRNDQEWGLVPFWCHAHPYLSQMIPTIWHTAAIWLTVYLAIQRYVYVCVPSSVHLYCTPRTTKLCILSIVTLAFISEIPELFGKYMEHVVENNRAVCNLRYAPWVLEIVGVQMFYSLYYWFRVTFVHGVPCFLLLIFTCKLGRTIKAAEIRKRSWVTNSMDPNASSVVHDHNRRCSASSGSGRSLYATNRMLSVICSVFLSLEIPAAIIFALHFLTASHMIPTTSTSYHLLNISLIIRNILIVLTSPLQFAIYCSMSEQFRLTVRQLFSTRLLFVAQAQATFHGGKRYSLILVDVELLDPKSLITRRSLRANDQRRTAAAATIEMNNHTEPPRKQRVGRQVSFPNEVVEREENI